jgi:hypothetical protein
MNMNSNVALDTQFTSLESSLIFDLEKLAETIGQRGFKCRPHSPKSLINLRHLPINKKQILAKQIKNMLFIVSYTPDIQVPEGDHLERRYVEQALKMYDLECESDYWTHLEKDDVIEVYSTEDIQLFRTFNFFKISSYSLLDLLTNEWYHLWERPSYVLDVIVNAVGGIVNGTIQKTTSVKAARHIVKEIYNDNSIDFKCSSVLVEPTVICPLYAKGTKDVKGFIFTLRGKVIGYDGESNKIAVI